MQTYIYAFIRRERPRRRAFFSEATSHRDVLEYTDYIHADYAGIQVRRPRLIIT